jgi:glycosyltransferase involved in cell wall biosynthesis
LNPAVSVILPVHNGGDYLADAVSSILSQSLRELELLLVDDRSDDGAIIYCAHGRR